MVIRTRRAGSLGGTALVVLALVAGFLIGAAAPAGAAPGAIAPYKSVQVPSDAGFLGIDPTNGFLYTYRAQRVVAYTPNGVYASTSAALGLSEAPTVILEGTSVFVLDRLGSRVIQLDRFSLGLIAEYTTPFHQPAAGVRVGNALWLTDLTALSTFKLDLSSGVITTYTTWGPALFTAVTGTTQLVANVPGLVSTATVVDVATTPPTVVATKTFPYPIVFSTDPAGPQVLGVEGGTLTPKPVLAYSVPALNPTGEAYQPPAIGFNYLQVKPEVTTIGGGWLATMHNNGSQQVLSVYRRGTASVAATYETTGSPIGPNVAWRAADATLVTMGGTPNALHFYAIAGPTGPTGPVGEFTPVAPYRVFDSRSGTPDNPRSTPVGPGETVTAQVTGVGPVPANGVDAVVVNVTVLDASAPTFVTVYPAGAALPPVSNVNVTPGQLKVNAAFVRVGDGGAVTIFNAEGSASVIVDIQGFISNATGPAGSRFHALAPQRLLDTRATGAGPLGAGQTTALTVTGGAVPANATAVMLNVTLVDPSAPDYVVVYPAGSPEPVASNVNAGPGQVVPNLVVAKVGTGGQVNLGNVGANAHLVVDITGWWDNDRSTNAGRYVPEFQPMRWIDSRQGIGTIDASSYLPVTFGNYPNEAPHLLGALGGTGTLLVNTTVIAIDGGGYAQVYAGELEGNAPWVSNLNFAAGDTVANLAASRLGDDNRVIFNAEGSTTHVIMDLQGYFTNAHY